MAHKHIGIFVKRLLLYLVTVEAVALLINVLLPLTRYLRHNLAPVPAWTVPVALAVLIVSAGAVFLRRFYAADGSKYEFITVVTHKLRTPLTRIKWAAEDIASAMPEQKKDNLEIILESERQILALTDMLAHLSDADATDFDYRAASVSAAELIEKLKSQYEPRARRKGVAATFEGFPGLAFLLDPEKSSLVFQILLDNALNYTPSGGSISVKAYPDQEARWGRIEVRDSGIGMSKKTASRVFERFYRGDNAKHTDTEGMGIGLFMAKAIVEKQGGRIFVESAGEGKGSAFTLRLPLAADA